MRHVTRIECLLAAGLVAWAAPAGCERETQTPVGRERRPPNELRAASYAIDDGALNHVGSAELLALLPGVDREAADTVDGCPSAAPELGELRFLDLRASPDGRWAAWEAGGGERASEWWDRRSRRLGC